MVEATVCTRRFARRYDSCHSLAIACREACQPGEVHWTLLPIARPLALRLLSAEPCWNNTLTSSIGSTLPAFRVHPCRRRLRSLRSDPDPAWSLDRPLGPPCPANLANDQGVEMFWINVCRYTSSISTSDSVLIRREVVASSGSLPDRRTVCVYDFCRDICPL
jgi:hypothetical protein